MHAQRSVLLGSSDRVGRLPWQPTVDGDLLPRTADPLARNQGRGKLEVLIGTNRDEWKLFTSASIALRAMGFPELERRIERLLEKGDLRAAVGSAAVAAALYRDITKERGYRQTAYEAWVGDPNRRILSDAGDRTHRVTR